MSEMNPVRLTELANAITAQIEQARGQLRQTVNSVMVQNYWNMRQFYQTFSIRDAVRSELSWSTRALEQQALVQLQQKGWEV